MKNYLLLISFYTIAFVQTYAQVTITQEDLPSVGRTVEYSNGENDFFELPSTGVGQNWNFTDFTPGDTFVTTIRNASESPYASKFPDATLFEENNVGEENDFVFYIPGKNGLYAAGLYFGSYDSTIRFQKPALLYAAPISFGETIHDSSRVYHSGLVKGLQYTITTFSRETFQAVGYGNISTPAGTFNTLLIKASKYIYDSTIVYLPESPDIQIELDTNVSYFWVQKNKNLPVVFEMGLTNSGDAVLYASYYSTDIPTALQILPNTDFSNHYPVPADTRVTIELRNPKDGIFTLSTLDGVKQLSIPVQQSKRIEVPTSELTAGMYVYEFKSDDGSIIKNKIVVTH